MKFLKVSIRIDRSTSVGITACYWSPASDMKDLITNLHTYLDNNNNTFKYSFFVGDININILNDNTIVTEYVNTLNKSGYIGIRYQ